MLQVFTEVSSLSSQVNAANVSIATEVTRATVTDSYLSAAITTLNVAFTTFTVNITNSLSSLAGNFASSSSSVALASPEYWTDCKVMNGEVRGITNAPANLNNTILKILGVGFQTYFNPDFDEVFYCIFFTPLLGNMSTSGNVVYSTIAVSNFFLFYHLECLIPVVSIATTLRVSVIRTNGLVYPFAGFQNDNIVTIQYYWASVSMDLPTGNNPLLQAISSLTPSLGLTLTFNLASFL